MNNNIRILSIETSCDETGISIVEYDKNTRKYNILADNLNSQIDIHREFGGVFPTVAKREHGNNLLHLLKMSLENTDIDIKNKINTENINTDLLNKEKELKEFVEKELESDDSIFKSIPNIDYIAVTVGPGLEPALWVGLSFVKFLSCIWQKPLIPINHMEGHISSVLLENENISFPSLSLLISGGHTEIVNIEDWGKYKIIGKTRDDAVGEAYDKAARILGLDYPGGPEISKRSEKIRKGMSLTDIQNKKDEHRIKLPRPMIRSQDLDLSFSGLKTAVLYMVRDMKKINEILDEEIINLICHEFEESVSEVLLSKLDFANKNNEYKYKNLIVAGGVISNEFLKENISIWCKDKEINFLKPSKKLATDNSIMIALAALIGLRHKYVKILQPYEKDFIELKPDGDWSLNNI